MPDTTPKLSRRRKLLNDARDLHGSWDALALAADVTTETLRRLAGTDNRMSFATASALDRACGDSRFTDLVEEGVRGFNLYSTPIGKAVLERAAELGVKPTRLLRQHGLNHNDFCRLCHQSPHENVGDRARRRRAVARLLGIHSDDLPLAPDPGEPS